MATNFEVYMDVFKTNVRRKSDAQVILQLLSYYFPDHHIDFDLEDPNRPLRFRGEQINKIFVKNALLKFGFTAEVLT